MASSYELDLNAIPQQDRDLIISRVSNYSNNELIERRSLLVAALEDEKEEPNSTQNSNEEDDEDDEALIYFELNVINIALSIGGAALLYQIFDSDSDKDDDSSFPVITINGNNPVTVELGDVYTDAGATAVDSESNPLTVTSSGTVDTSIVGSYTITYSATDSQGRTSYEYRTVIVVDTIAPVITIAGDNPVTVEVGDTYTDAGATASDASGSATVTSSGTVDTSTPMVLIPLPIQQLMLQVILQPQQEQIIVEDTIAPVIAIAGDNPVSIEQYQTHIPMLVLQLSDALGSATVTSSGTVDTSTPGTYTITYTA